jgi:hypothetical protein
MHVWLNFKKQKQILLNKISYRFLLTPKLIRPVWNRLRMYRLTTHNNFTKHASTHFLTWSVISSLSTQELQFDLSYFPHCRCSCARRFRNSRDRGQDRGCKVGQGEQETLPGNLFGLVVLKLGVMVHRYIILIDSFGIVLGAIRRHTQELFG